LRRRRCAQLLVSRSTGLVRADRRAKASTTTASPCALHPSRSAPCGVTIDLLPCGTRPLLRGGKTNFHRNCQHRRLHTAAHRDRCMFHPTHQHRQRAAERGSLRVCCNPCVHHPRGWEHSTGCAPLDGSSTRLERSNPDLGRDPRASKSCRRQPCRSPQP
jgi:hypothetical protein